jgi:hypothetical protein
LVSPVVSLHLNPANNGKLQFVYASVPNIYV